MGSIPLVALMGIIPAREHVDCPFSTKTAGNQILAATTAAIRSSVSGAAPTAAAANPAKRFATFPGRAALKRHTASSHGRSSQPMSLRSTEVNSLSVMGHKRGLAGTAHPGTYEEHAKFGYSSANTWLNQRKSEHGRNRIIWVLRPARSGLPVTIPNIENLRQITPPRLYPQEVQQLRQHLAAAANKGAAI